MTSVESAVPVKTPEPDQYWEHVKSKDRVYFIGRNPEGVMVWQCEGDTVEIGNLDWSDWRHIPDCTGWDWEMEKQLHAEVFPQYWTSPFVGSKAAFVKRVSDTDCFAVMPNGKEGPLLSWHHSFPEKREQITEEQALGLLDKPYVGCAEIQNGPIVISNKQANEIQAILDKPAEQWPKYYVRDTWLDAYVRRDGDSTTTTIGKDGSYKPWQTKFPDMLPEGWREVTKAEALARVKPVETWPKYYVTVTDSRHYYRCDSAGDVWAVTENGEERQGSPACALLDTAIWKEVTEDEAKAIVNPAGGWVVQDRVPARPGIDQGWWAYKGDAVDPSGSSWWDFQSTDSAAGKEHGYPHIEGYVLHLRCRRKDLPAVPAPIEETFPQWYILKESEVHQALTPWAIKRTGEETSIRYAYDGGDKLLASNETWYGATDVWRQCHSAEAFQRLGILGEAYLPAVPADKRRVPIKAWVTYRLADEGGDWPVRATPADQTYQNWKEIKFDSNGMFIEVDQ